MIIKVTADKIIARCARLVIAFPNQENNRKTFKLHLFGYMRKLLALFGFPLLSLLSHSIIFEPDQTLPYRHWLALALYGFELDNNACFVVILPIKRIHFS